VVLASGCFDGFHYGHLAYLKAAMHYGCLGVVDVAVASDAYIRRVKHREPRWPQAQRAAVIRSITFVHDVIIHDDHGAADVIMAWRPKVFIKGIDWESHVPGDVQAACDLVGCRIAFVDSHVNQHTSDALSSQ